MGQTILIIEDDPGIRGMLAEYLSAHGYTVRQAHHGRQGLEEARFAPPDLVLLDLMMPQLGGIDTLRALRERSDVPVIVLTAKDSEADKVLGLELGADDYVTKPFSLAELLARVRAQLRRQGRPARRLTTAGGELELDLDGRSVQARGQEVSLTRTEFDLLAALIRAPGRVFSRAELLEAAQEEALGAERTVDVHIRNLRGKLERDPTRPELLLTVFGVGYRLRGD